MITVKLNDELHGDIVAYHSDNFAYEDGEMEEDFSPDCISFINKATQAKLCRRLYEMKATQQEISAVIDEVLETVKLIEVTLVLSIETYGVEQMFCGMDYLVVQDEAQVLGWSERELQVTPKEGE
jgi:hypothetical protein